MIGSVSWKGQGDSALYYPTQLPESFRKTREGTSRNKNNKVVHTWVFKNNEEEEFSLSQQKKGDLSVCQKPDQESSAYNYIIFHPSDTDWGCAVSLDIGKEKRRIFHWLRNGTRFSLLVKNDSITDQQVADLAESLVLKDKVTK